MGLLLATPLTAFATGNLHYSADTTISVGSFSITIGGGSDATSLIINDNATLTVTIPQNHTFTLSIPNGNSLIASPTAIEQSCGTPNQISILPPGTFTITPQATACTKATAIIGGGGAGGNTTPTTTTLPPATPAAPAAKPFTFELPSEKGSFPAASGTASQGTVATPAAVEAMKADAKELAVVPKKIVFDAEDKQVLAAAKKAGITVDTTGRGVKAQVASSKANNLVLNFLTKDTETLQDMSLKEKVQILAETQYLIGSKLRNEADIAKALKVAEGIPLNDRELGKKALTDIKRNESAFCKQGACKGFATFDRILRGGEVPELTQAQQTKGAALFKKNTKRAPDLNNPLHANLVKAFAVSDLTVIKPAPKAKAKAPSKPAPKAANKPAVKKK